MTKEIIPNTDTFEGGIGEWESSSSIFDQLGEHDLKTPKHLKHAIRREDRIPFRIAYTLGVMAISFGAAMHGIDLSHMRNSDYIAKEAN